MVSEQACQWALTERRTLGSRFEPQAAYSSDCSAVLSLRPSARAAPPSGPSLLNARLCTSMGGGGEACQWAVTERRKLGARCTSARSRSSP
jgi:hypothetical protein